MQHFACLGKTHCIQHCTKKYEVFILLSSWSGGICCVVNETVIAGLIYYYDLKIFYFIYLGYILYWKLHTFAYCCVQFQCAT